MYDKFKYHPSGDQGIIIEVGNEISKDINRKIQSLIFNIDERDIKGVVELIPTYKSILVSYNPLIITYIELINELKNIEESTLEVIKKPTEIIHIPVLYGGKYGEDLGYVAQYNDLTEEEVVSFHCENYYLIYMIGFTPGFPYLGGLSKKIHTPRLKSPREKILNGTVGIAGSQTGIYPIDSPGGWRAIGRTPLKLFDIDREPAVLLNSGIYIKFEQIDIVEYEKISKEVFNGIYKVKKTFINKGEIYEKY